MVWYCGFVLLLYLVICMWFVLIFLIVLRDCGRLSFEEKLFIICCEFMINI